MSAINRRAVVMLRTQQPAIGLLHDIVDTLIQQHRADCRRDAVPGEGCEDHECPHAAECPGRVEVRQ